MILALDTYYRENMAKTVGIAFHWNDLEPRQVYTAIHEPVKPYISGQFYQRELPCLKQLLDKIDLSSIEAIIVDGYVFVDNEKKYGLGGHLWETLGQTIPVIGVAKNALKDTEKVSVPLLRGKSTNPLYVSTMGLPLDKTATKVEKMQGPYRIPTLLKKLDQLTREK